MYLKGHIANSVQYGKMYLAAVNAEKAAGIHTPLCTTCPGTTRGEVGRTRPAGPRTETAEAGCVTRSTQYRASARRSSPMASARIPTGPSTKNSADESGVQALAAQERVAQTVLGSVPTFYVTEFGYNMAACGAASGACSEAEQASKTRAAIKAFLGDPHFAGIFIYQSHDDGTGHFGYMNNDNTTRPTFGVLSELAERTGSVAASRGPRGEYRGPRLSGRPGPGAWGAHPARRSPFSARPCSRALDSLPAHALRPVAARGPRRLG